MRRKLNQVKTGKEKGEYAEAVIMAEIIKKGYRIAIPWGENWAVDFVVCRDPSTGDLEKIQCKYTESDGKTISVGLRRGNKKKKRYNEIIVDWLIVYDNTSKRCYYIPSHYLKNKKTQITLKIGDTNKKNRKNLLLAENFTDF